MPKYLKITFSLMLVVYLVVALVVTVTEPDSQLCRGISIAIVGEDEARDFVSAQELARELDSLPQRAREIAVGNIDTRQLRNRLLAMDKLEDVDVVRLSDGSIRIRVVPIIPVARVMDPEDDSYYINRIGKRVKADARYHKDVPLIEGRFDPRDTLFTPLTLLPIVEKIAADSVWNAYFSMVKVKGPNDIILVPRIREHVVNIGSPDNLDEKLSRLRRFYSEVLTKQGWQKYDTISLKWSGQIVATRRAKPAPKLSDDSFDDEETVDTGTMLAGDDVAPGQTVPGVEAHSEKRIPGSNN